MATGIAARTYAIGADLRPISWLTARDSTKRAQGDARLAALRSDMDSRRAEIERQIVEVGAELSDIADERDAARAALEELVELRARIGLELVEYRGHVVFVVPDGRELVAWRAPGLADLASHNGLMYRLSQ